MASASHAHSEAFVQRVQIARAAIKETTIDNISGVIVEKLPDFKAYSSSSSSSGSGSEEVTSPDLPFVLVDVREESEFDAKAGHILGAIHIGKGVIERDIEAKIPDKTTPLVLYCGGGYRSALAAESIQLMGYTNVLSMDGGFRGWKDAGLPVAVESKGVEGGSSRYKIAGFNDTP